MKVIKKIANYTFRGISLFIGFIAIYLISSVACKHITTNNNYVTPIKGYDLFVISNGVHADICLPLDEKNSFWNNYFNANDFISLKAQPKYISFGWGDKGFFLETPTWSDLTSRTALRALFIASPSTLHVSYLENKPQLSETTKSFRVDDKGLKKIENYILAHVKFNNDQPQLIDCCRYPNLHDNFYEANGDYHLFRTCNVWANQVAQEAGVKTSVWTPFDSSLLHQFE